MNLEILYVTKLSTGVTYHWDTDLESADDLMERLHICDDEEEREVRGEFSIDQSQTLDDIHSLAQWANEHSDFSVEFIGDYVNPASFYEVERAWNTYYIGEYDSFREYAAYVIDEGLMGDISDKLIGYIDYDLLAHDLEIEAEFIEGQSGTIYILAT